MLFSFILESRNGHMSKWQRGKRPWKGRKDEQRSRKILYTSRFVRVILVGDPCYLLLSGIHCLAGGTRTTPEKIKGSELTPPRGMHENKVAPLLTHERRAHLRRQEKARSTLDQFVL